MSSSDRRTFLSLIAAASVAAGVAGCGFTPAYGPKGAARTLRGKISPANPTTRDGFDFVGRIEERLDPPSDPLYDLAFSISTSEGSAAVTPTGEIGRYNVFGTVTYSLRDLASGTVMAQGKLSNVTAYSAIGTTVQTLYARRDAHRRLMVILADSVVTALIAKAGDWNK